MEIGPAPDAYTECVEAFGENATANEMLKCFSKSISSHRTSLEYTRSLGLVFAAALVFLMQAGFAMVCAGAVRTKNVQNTMLKNLLDACGASIAFFSVGYAFAFGGQDPTSSKKTFVGTDNFFLYGVDDLAFWMFQYAFAAASCTIIAGTLAERCQMTAYLCYSVVLVGWVYPVIVHSVWSHQGWISANGKDPLFGVGMIDFAGSGVVHLTGGTTAIFAAMILGPRRGRFHDDMGRKLDKPKQFIGHSTALQMLGTFILWFGWFGFNGGSALLIIGQESYIEVALATTNTALAGGAAGITALFINLWYLERYTGEPFFDLKFAMNGCLTGLVAITGPCGVVEPWAAVVIGFFGGLVYMLGSRFLEKIRIDDAVDAIPVHGFGGIWGLISVGLFASPRRLQHVYGHATHPGLFYSWRERNFDATLLGTQLLGMIFIIGWVMVIMLPFFVWLDWKGWFRSDPLEEIVGLDTSYHGGLALLAGHDAEVNPEYMSAYQKKKSEGTLRRRMRFSDTPASTSNSERPQNDDNDIVDEDAAYEEKIQL